MGIRSCKSCKGNGFVTEEPCGCREALCPHTRLMDTATEPQAGLYHKFWVKRTDGSSAPGGKHEDCEYFVLDLQHDPNALLALKAYADGCEGKFPELAQDLRALLKRHA